MLKNDFSTLMRLVTASAQVGDKCSCNSVPLAAWQKLPTSLAPDRFKEVGTLVDAPPK